MSFLRAQRPSNGCSCERRGTRARIGMGDVTDPVAQAESIAAGASQSLASSLAKSPAIAKRVMLLQAQLNRYGNSAPDGFRFVPEAPLPVDGVLSVADAAHAVAILQWRSRNQLAAYPGETAAALSKLQSVTSPMAVLDPVGWVLGDLAGVTSLLQKYGDANRLPKAAAISIFDSLSDPGTMVLVGGVALAIYLGGK